MTDGRSEVRARMSLFEECSDAVVAFGAEDQAVLTANPAAERLFGRTAGELVGRPVAALFAPDPDEDFVPVGDEATLPPRLFGGTAQEVQARRADGSEVAVEVVVSHASAGGVTFYMAGIRDIAERKRRERRLRHSEAQFRAAVETLGEGLLITDLEDRVVYVNARMSQMAEYAPEQMLGRTVAEMLVPTDEIEAYRSRSQMRLQGISEQYDVLLKRRGGDTFWAEVNATPFRDPRGRIVGTLSAVLDVTERKRIQEELVAAVDAAEDASRAKSAFLANMSHELRTPLNAILGYSEMLEEEFQERELGELLPDLKKVHDAGKHLLSLINDILDLSKIEAGRMDILLEDFDVKALVGEAVATVQGVAAKNGDTIELECDDAIGSMRADPTRVRQVLLNHLGNAAKFTQNGTIRVVVAPDELNGRPAVRFEVRDTGIGMSPEQVDKLFQPFVQVDTSATRKYGGSGLGLVISRQLCGQMGGDVAVESQVGSGSTFTIVLPRHAGAVEERPERPTPVAAAAGDGPATVLVVDDDSLVRDLMQRFLTKQGFRVATASGGEEGLQRARELRPSLITLDVIMPDLDGWAVLKRLKADPELAPIPVLMMTIIDNPKLGFSLGASEYVTKPIDWRRLGAALARFRPAAAREA